MNLRKSRFLSKLTAATLTLSALTLTVPSAANAATIGDAPCLQTVDVTTGVSVFRDGSSCYVAFKSAISYSWTPPAGVNSINLLVVAGGGGGGSRHAGGGGAGGLINNLDVALTSNNLSITVGAGGAGGAAAASGGNNGSNGFNSVVSGTGLTTRTAVGGGGGSYAGATNAGGSGGGGGSTSAGGTATAGQGNSGGSGLTNNSTYWVGGGGGGADGQGGAGVTSPSIRGGNGGDGLEISWITSAAASNTGVGVLSAGKYYLAGGGGGGTDRNEFSAGSAGIGGGGIGANGSAGTAGNGSANSGGGGGGSGISGVASGSRKGGDGGSGVVLIHYIIPSAQFTASNYTAGSTTWANDISGGTSGTAPSGGMQKTISGPVGVVFAGKESSNSDQLTSSIGSTSSVDSVTVEMWVKLKDSGNSQNAAGSMLFSWNTSTTNYNIYHYDNNVGFNTFQSQLFGVNSTSYNNTWTHLVFVMTDTGPWAGQKIYVNGVNQSLTCRVGSNCTDGFSRTFSTTGNFMLMNHPNAANTWNALGDLGIVRVYNRELTAGAIQNIYNATSASYYEAPDTTAPTITGPSSATGANSSISIVESSTAVHSFTANESVTWSKSGTDESFFSITSAGGVLTISARDFESPVDNGSNNTYVVTITATDSVGNATNQTLTATITNLNEAPTITTASSAATHTISQAENISSVVTYAGSDVDAGTTLTWSISGTDAADFSINSSSGVLAFATNPDFEAPVDSDTNNSYIVIIAVSDGSMTDTQTVTITITNSNESASINAPTVSGAITKGIVTTITVTINVAGKVRFFVGNKRISTCKERITSGTYPNNTATCNWKPAVTGRQFLTATLTPTDNTFSSSTSARTEVFVLKRGTTR